MQSFDKNYKRLNLQQKQAVDIIHGPVMVVAGPGTGKTQILALRIANILKLTDTSPDSILCLTFTESGVKAMRERLIQFIGADAYKVHIHTFHSFSNELIQTNPDIFAFTKELIQLDELTRVKIMREIIDESSVSRSADATLIPFYDKYAKVGMIISDIQSLKKEGIDPDELKGKNNALRKQHEENPVLRGGKPTKTWEREFETFDRVDEFAEIYKEYQKKLSENGYYDYEDMINFVIEAFKANEDFLRDVQERYLYVLVDEFQDTNGSQNEIMQLLGNFDTSPNIFVVGDDDQAIYRFQGANIENVMSFREHFDKVQIIPTTVNYRSSAHILEIAEDVISKNENRLVNKYEDVEKKLTANTPSPSYEEGKTELHEFANGDEENMFIAKEIQRLHDHESVPYEEIAVLFRKNKHAGDINEMLQKFGIPTKLDTSKTIFEIEIIQKLIRLLTVISLYDKHEDELLYEVMQYDFIGLDTVDVYKLTRYAHKNKVKLLDLLLEFSDEELNDDTQVDTVTDKQINLFTDKQSNQIDISLKCQDRILGFINNLTEWHNLSANVSFPKFVERIINDSGMLNFVMNQEDEKTSFEDVLAINSFFEFIKQQYRINKESNLFSFLEDLALIKDNFLKVSVPKSNTQKDAVNLLTAHGSKGLEFRYVFIIKATDGSWGSARRMPTVVPKQHYVSIDTDLDEKALLLEDERRLFFVAITRAKEKLYFTYANEYNEDGNVRAANVSSFITEIDSSLYATVPAAEHKLQSDDYITKLSITPLQDYSEDEKDFLREQIENFKLTPSNLNEYLESPLEFKKNQLIKVPKAPNKHLALGTAIHFALEQLQKEYMQKDSYSTVDVVLKNFSQKLYAEFYGDEEYERTLEEGTQILSDYYNFYHEHGGITKAAEVEYGFYFHNIFLETHDSSEPIPLSGRLDKIEHLSGRDVDISPTQVKLIDYKTTTPKSENEIRGLTKTSDGSYWRQLVFYKLLTDLDSKFRPNRSFSNPKYEVMEVEIDFLKKDPKSKKFLKRSFEITPHDVEGLKELIYEVMKRIRNLEFPEKCDLT